MAQIVVNPNDSVRVSIFTRMQNQIGVNVRGYKLDALAPVTIDGDVAATAFYDQFVNEYQVLLTDIAQFYGVTVVFGANTTNPTMANSTTPPTNGIAGNAPLPRQTSGLIKLTTGFIGRQNRGRIYVPFPDEVHNGPSGVPTDGYFTLLLSLGTALTNPVTAGGAVFNPFLLGQQNSPTRQITGFTARNLWATQRRRGAFGAANNPPF